MLENLIKGKFPQFEMKVYVAIGPQGPYFRVTGPDEFLSGIRGLNGYIIAGQVIKKTGYYPFGDNEVKIRTINGWLLDDLLKEPITEADKKILGLAQG